MESDPWNEVAAAREQRLRYTFEMVSGMLQIPAELDDYRNALTVTASLAPSGAITLTASGVVLELPEGLSPAAAARAVQQFGLFTIRASAAHERHLQELFERAHSRHIRYMPDADEFFCYREQGYWEPVTDDIIMQTVRDFAEDGLAFVAELPPPPTAAQRRAGAADPWGPARKHLNALNNSEAARGTVIRGAKQGGSVVRLRDFEAAEEQRPNLILTPGGVIDYFNLARGTRAPRPEDYFRACTIATYRPDAPVPEEWGLIRDYIFSDAEGVYLEDREEYFWLLLGAGLMGTEGAKRWEHYYGVSDGIKTTALWIYVNALADPRQGGYAVKLPNGALILKDRTGHTSDRMGIARGPRCLFADELPRNQPLDYNFIKEVLGGGTVVLSEKGKPSAAYTVRAVLMTISDKEELRLPADDAGTWDNRLFPYKFERALPAELKVVGRGMELARHRGLQDYVFTRALEGAARLARGARIVVPEAFRCDLAAMRLEEDPIAQWVESGGDLVLDPEGTFKFKDAYALWKAYCRRGERQRRPGRDGAFADALRRIPEIYAPDVRDRDQARLWRGARITAQAL